MKFPVRTPARLLATLGLLASLMGVLPGAAPPDDPSGQFPENWHMDSDHVILLRRLEGQRAPELTGVQWDGPAQSLRELRGQIVVLDFWAVWCPHCLPALKLDVDLLRRYGDRGVTVLGIHDGSNAGQKDWEEARKAAAEKGVRFPIGLDGSEKGQSVMSRYNARFFPAYVIIDREGIVRAAGVLPERVKDVVEKLLAAPSAPVVLAEFPSEVYAGGESRLSTLRALEGKAASPLVSETWIGAPRRVDSGTGLTVLHFFSSTNQPSLTALKTLVSRRDELAEQGATIVAMADAHDDWSRVMQLAEAGGWGISIALDTLPPDAGASGTGRTAAAYGVAVHCPTLVVDQHGVIRAAGLRAERVLDAVKHIALHSEPSLMKSAPTEARQ